MTSQHNAQNEDSQMDMSERSELVLIPPEPQTENAPSVQAPSPREMVDMTTKSSNNRQWTAGGVTVSQDEIMAKLNFYKDKALNRTICCCRASVFYAFMGVVLISFIIGLSVSAVNHTLAFANRNREPAMPPYCKYFALYNSTEQDWNIAFYSSGLVDVWDDTVNQTVQKLQQGVFIEFAFKNGSTTRRRFNLKGVSWSGFETSTNLFSGLYDQTPDRVFEFLSRNGFNAIRIPFYLGMLDGKVKPSHKELYSTNSKLVQTSSLNDLETMVMIAAQNGMLVILDLHSFGPGTATQDGLWYSDQYGEWNVTQEWIMVAKRFRKYWNVIGADIRNEMWNSTWGGWDYDHDIKGAQERIGLSILEAAPQWVVFVEGTLNSPASVTETFAGENLIGVQDDPFNFTLMDDYVDKFFYTPHVYGPAMADFGYFERDNFSNYLPEIWRAHWGYIQENSLGTILIGAWGTQISDDPDTQAQYDSWSQALVQYLGDIGARDAFYWGVNHDLYGVAGLLQADWVTPNQNPLDWAAALQPNPSRLTYYQRGGAFCLQ